MSTSVVIPAWNGKTHLTQNLPSVLAIGADEVIVSDDASTDGSADYVASHFPAIRLVRNAQNLRFPKNVNQAINQSRADFIVLLNQDVRPDKDILKHALPHFKNSDIFAVTFNEQNHSWAKAEFKNGWLEYTNGILDTNTHYTLWASGAGSVFRKSYWDQLGGFDEKFHPGYVEDLDIGWRAWKRGYKILWEPQSKIVHTPESAYSKAFLPIALQRVKERNYILTQWKNLDTPNLLAHLVALLKRTLHHPGFIAPVLMSLLDLPHVLNYRINHRPVSQVPDSRVFTHFSK